MIHKSSHILSAFICLLFASISLSAQTVRVEAENYDAMFGIATQTTGDVDGGGLNIKNIAPGDWMDYNLNIASGGTYEMKFRVASLSAGANFDLKNGGTTLGSVSEPATNGYQIYATATKIVTLPSGSFTLRIEATGSNWNFNWFEYTPYTPPPRDPNKPNIVFMFADDLGYGDLGVYGHPYAHSPNLDQLASEGSRFTNFYMTGNVCGPSRTGIMSGRHPDTFANNVPYVGLNGRAAVTHLVKDGGYVPGHYGKWHIGMDDPPYKPIPRNTYGIADENINVDGGSHSDIRGRDAQIYDRAMEFIERHQHVPFYLNIWGYTTHSPVTPSQALVDELKGIKPFTFNRNDFGEHMQPRFDALEANGQTLQTAMENYMADVYGLDKNVGRVLAKLDELGLRDNTIVVFSSDNGAATDLIQAEGGSPNMIGYSGGLRGFKHTNYEGGFRQQLLVRWPGNVPAGRVDKASVMSGLDWLPTVVSLTGSSYGATGTYTARDRFEGEDMSDVWLGAERVRTNPMFWKFSGQTVIQGNWKLTEESEDYLNGSGNPQGGAKLFDLSVDEIGVEGNGEDVSALYPDVVSKLSAKMSEWRSQIVESSNKVLPEVNDPRWEALVVGPADIPLYRRGGPSGDPVVSFVNPTTNILAGADLAFEVSATDSDGIDYVEFYIDGTPMRTENNSPFNWSVSQGDTELQNMTAGVYQFRAVAFDTLGNDGEATVSVTVVNPGDFSSVKINFQPAASVIPAGYMADTSQVFANRGNGYSYGWDSAFDVTRERNADSDQRLDTLNHTQNNGADHSWEIEVPNGDYQVTLVGGDPSFPDSTLVFYAEEGTANSIELINGALSSSQKFITGTQTVTVSDGRLTISNGPGANKNKICYIDIASVTPPNNAPVITSTEITTADENVPYSYTATATDADGDNLTWTGLIVPSWLTFNSSGVLSGTPDASNVGDHSISLVVSDGLDNDFQNFTITVNAAPDPYAVWKTANNVTDDNADDDNDGIPNLMEFALGCDPRSANSGQRPQVDEVSSNFEFKFKRQEATVTYTVEKSTDLINWTDHMVVNDTHGTVGNDATVPVPVSEMNNGKLFLRLKVEN